MEDRLLESSLFSCFLERSTDAILCLSNQSNILKINLFAQRIYGWDERSVIGKSYFSLCQKSKVTPIVPNQNDMMALENFRTISQKIVTDEGFKRELNWTVDKIFDKNKQLYCFLLIGKDLSKESLLIEEKNRLEVYLNNLISQIPEYVFWKDKNFAYLGCNDQLARAAGLTSKSDIVGKTDRDFGWDKNRIKKLREIDTSVLTTGKENILEEEIPLPADGSKRIMITHKTPLKDEKGNLIGILGVSTDITDRKRMEENLREAKEEAETANVLKDQFIQNMEHDLRTPSSGLVGLLSVMVDRVI